ncbi:aldehyde dehydrogenase family protein [Oceanobacillus salinisoli]|uniref:aldehyde dehydrogenase family protein n=1 Tax=Oceanobacillus salinisoli TaxID=2678611 RepID=UPI0018CC401B|nr:aldehyde dehydrogenase family protein [Oceanobacillus salinisoli]
MDIGKQEGGELLVGGDATESKFPYGYYVKPTVVANVTNDMTIPREEIFGPVVSGMLFDDIDEVIKLANQTEYGLGGGICTTNIGNAPRVAHAMRTGNVWINTYNLLDPATPYGGYKQSGLGGENGSAAIDMFTETKSVWVNLD